MIVCSPLNSATTSRILRRYKDLQHAKILLIDIIGSVFNTENEIYTYNKHHNIFVLTILSEKFKTLLNTTISSDFSHYYHLDLDTLLDNGTTMESDSGLWFNESQLFKINENLCNLTSFFANVTIHNLYKNQTLCEKMLKSFCRMPVIDISSVALKMKIKQLCHVISNTSVNDDKVTNNSNNDNNKSFTSVSNNNDINPSTNHIIFSEYFNLFNYVIYMVTDSKNNRSDEKSFQFDFVILDFKRVDNGSTIIWRPFLILQQNHMAQGQFTMHTIISDYFDRIIASPGTLVSTCGIWCWLVIAIVVILLILIIFFSILIGIAVR